jgi:hypothetical protein
MARTIGQQVVPLSLLILLLTQHRGWDAWGLAIAALPAALFVGLTAMAALLPQGS